ncbi:MAG TPA: Fe-S cluster assembly ATPase SufC [Limnochordia bacterium]|nr:Fe-S cluster assembly ATPase SufC [Limnochordia bacterium]
MSQTRLAIKDLHAAINGKEILKGVDLEVNGGEVHAIMGPNGSGKSTLANSVMGHPRYEITSGEVTLNGQDLLSLAVDERARAGVFMAFQYPSEVPGVTVANFLRSALNARRPKGQEISVGEFAKLLREKMRLLEMDPSFAGRYLNEGFSGGEKKRNEILQMAMLQPHIAILDETDSGLDIDALKIVSDGVNAQRSDDLGVLVITHYERILRYLQPDFVHVFIDGRVVKSGGRELAAQLEEQGYDKLREELEASAR